MWKGQGETGRFPPLQFFVTRAVGAARVTKRAFQKKGVLLELWMREHVEAPVLVAAA